MIVGLKVCRRSIAGYLKGVIRVVSGQRRDLYHTWMELTLSNGKHVILEKNQAPTMFYGTSKPGDECREVPIPQRSLGDFVQNALNQLGRAFFEYHATRANCQVFVMGVLKANGIQLSPELEKFVLQDVKGLLPAWADRIMKTITDTASRADLVKKGYGKTGGAVWGLTPDQQKRYIEDTRKGVNLRTVNGTTFWHDPLGGGDNFLTLPDLIQIAKDVTPPTAPLLTVPKLPLLKKKGKTVTIDTSRNTVEEITARNKGVSIASQNRQKKIAKYQKEMEKMMKKR